MVSKQYKKYRDWKKSGIRKGRTKQNAFFVNYSADGIVEERNDGNDSKIPPLPSRQD